MKLKIAAVTALALGLTVAVGAQPASTGPTQPWGAPALEQAASIRDGRTGASAPLASMLDDLQHADVVFLGETHTDETTHRLELRIYEELLRHKQGKVVLALEMFNRDDQQHLDAYLSGLTDEEQFTQAVRHWSNYREAYRPLVELAKQAGSPVIASNFPKSLLRRVAMNGAKEFGSLSEAEKKLVPGTMLANTPAYWRRVDNATRGHAGFVPPRVGGDARLYSVQSLWDNAMGDSCAAALKTYPGHSVLHINGGFHSAYWDGAARQAKLRIPDAAIKTVHITPSPNPATEKLTGLPVADYVVLAESRASNLEQGVRSVAIGRRLEYLLHEPDTVESDGPLPLLIWLADDGLGAKEVLPYCKQRFGGHAIVAVVQPPYKEIGADFAVGGRWFWPESFAEDSAAIAVGVERIWAYLCRHYPIDPQRVCLAGEGTGATVAAAIAARTDRIQLNAIAVRPRRYAKLKDLPLLLPQFYPKGALPNRSLTVLAGGKDQSWWDDELQQYQEAGLNTELVPEHPEPWRRRDQAAAAVLSGIGVDADAAATQPSALYYLRLKTDSPREFLWARIQAGWLMEESGGRVVVTRERLLNPQAIEAPMVVTPVAAAAKGVLPRCPGPFGGTTVLLLPAGVAPEDEAAWIKIEEENPLNAESRFHRVRIATLTSRRPLRAVLEELHKQNRNNVLIVPACFYADGPTLRTAKDAVRSLEDVMTIQWMPGLGGRPGAVSLPRAEAP